MTNGKNLLRAAADYQLVKKASQSSRRARREEVLIIFAAELVSVQKYFSRKGLRHFRELRLAAWRKPWSASPSCRKTSFSTVSAPGGFPPGAFLAVGRAKAHSPGCGALWSVFRAAGHRSPPYQWKAALFVSL